MTQCRLIHGTKNKDLAHGIRHALENEGVRCTMSPITETSPQQDSSAGLFNIAIVSEKDIELLCYASYLVGSRQKLIIINCGKKNLPKILDECDQFSPSEALGTEFTARVLGTLDIERPPGQPSKFLSWILADTDRISRLRSTDFEDLVSLTLSALGFEVHNEDHTEKQTDGTRISSSGLPGKVLLKCISHSAGNKVSVGEVHGLTESARLQHYDFAFLIANCEFTEAAQRRAVSSCPPVWCFGRDWIESALRKSLEKSNMAMPLRIHGTIGAPYRQIFPAAAAWYPNTTKPLEKPQTPDAPLSQPFKNHEAQFLATEGDGPYYYHPHGAQQAQDVSSKEILENLEPSLGNLTRNNVFISCLLEDDKILPEVTKLTESLIFSGFTVNHDCPSLNIGRSCDNLSKVSRALRTSTMAIIIVGDEFRRLDDTKFYEVELIANQLAKRHSARARVPVLVLITGGDYWARLRLPEIFAKGEVVDRRSDSWADEVASRCLNFKQFRHLGRRLPGKPTREKGR